MKILIVLSVLLATAAAAGFGAKSQLRHMDILPKGFFKPEGRIVGGEKAKNGQIPFQVGVELWTDISATSSSWCGGTLLSRSWVLTAAHCTYGMKIAKLYLGAVNRTEAKKVITSMEFYIHENYDPDLISDDISLIKLPLPVIFSSTVQPVVLPKISSSYSSYEGQTVIASGWGRTSDCTFSIAVELSYIFRTVNSNCDCALVYGTSMVRESNICVNTDDGDKKISTCNGDSGGPLVLNDSDRTLIGVTSYGAQEGCELGYPTVFTRVTWYLDWIKNISGVPA